MFVGREKELALLRQDYIGKAVMVYGKRRVGKTTLIQKALESHHCPKVYFECLKGTLQDNIDGLVQELVRAQILPVPLQFTALRCRMYSPTSIHCLKRWWLSWMNTLT